MKVKIFFATLNCARHKVIIHDLIQTKLLIQCHTQATIFNFTIWFRYVYKTIVQLWSCCIFVSLLYFLFINFFENNRVISATVKLSINLAFFFIHLALFIAPQITSQWWRRKAMSIFFLSFDEKNSSSRNYYAVCEREQFEVYDTSVQKPFIQYLMDVNS